MLSANGRCRSGQANAWVEIRNRSVGYHFWIAAIYPVYGFGARPHLPVCTDFLWLSTGYPDVFGHKWHNIRYVKFLMTLWGSDPGKFSIMMARHVVFSSGPGIAATHFNCPVVSSAVILVGIYQVWDLSLTYKMTSFNFGSFSRICPLRCVIGHGNRKNMHDAPLPWPQDVVKALGLWMGTDEFFA